MALLVTVVAVTNNSDCIINKRLVLKYKTTVRNNDNHKINITIIAVIA
jgi:hypothetical protein